MFVTRATRRVTIVEQDQLILLKLLSSPPVFTGVRVTRSLVYNRCLSFCPFSFVHCVVCSSYIHGFWLALLYLQTLLTHQVSYSEWLSLWLLVRAKWTICYLHHGENNKQELQEKFCRLTKTALVPWRQAETSLKIEDFRYTKPLVNFHKCEWLSTTRIEKYTWILHNYFF